MTDITTSKITLRKGATFDLPGFPTRLSPREWTDPLDAGELGFSDDQGRIFVGPDLSAATPQKTRLQYPYQNIEIIGENSREAFAEMHGARMREGDARDYYRVRLGNTIVGSVNAEEEWRAVEMEEVPYGFPIDATIHTTIDYLVTAQSAVRLRHGQMTLTFRVGDTSGDLIDEAEVVKINSIHPASLSSMRFRFRVIGSVLQFQYRYSGADYPQLWFKRSQQVV